MKIAIVAGMIERKLFSKIQPVIEQEKVEKLYLVRMNPFSHSKVECYYPKGIFAIHKIAGEIYRIMKIFQLAVSGKVDILIGIGHVPHGFYVCALGKILRKRVILLLMGKNDLYLTYPRDKFRQWLAFSIARWATLIGTRGTNSQAWLIKKGIKPERIFIPHNVFDFNDFVPETLPKKYDLVYIGLINFYKRVDLLVEVVKKLKSEFPDIRLAIIRKGRIVRKIEDMVRREGLSENIVMLPPGDKQYLNTLLNESKIFVMTSQGEGLPMAAVEAMSCGLPVVIFDDADNTDICKHDFNSFVCRLWDTDSFAAHIARLLKEDDTYARLSSNALRIRTDKAYEYSLEYAMKLWAETLEHLKQI